MFQAAQSVALTRPRKRRRFGMGDSTTDALFARGRISAVQSSLNNAYSPSGTRLTVDGVWGSKSIARMVEYQRFLGIPANGRVDDNAANVSLGLPGSSSGSGAIDLGQGSGGGTNLLTDVTAGVGGGGGAPESSGLQSLFDILTLKGVRDATSTVTQAAIDQAKVTGIWTNETAKAAAKAGGNAAAGALKWLSDNGDLFAKIALGLGVGYSAAVALALGGGGLLLIFLFTGKKR